MFALYNSKGYVIAAIVVGEDNTSSDNYAYALKAAQNEYKSGNYYYWDFIAVVNGNYALDAGLAFDDALVVEAADSLAAQTYANIVAVREGEENSEKTQVIKKVLTSDECKQFITDHFEGAVLPITSGQAAE